MVHAKRVLVLAVLVVLAGCGGGDPSGTPTPSPEGDRAFTLSVSSPGTTTYHVEVRLLAATPSNVSLTFANGTTRTLAVPNASGHFAPGDDLPTGVDAPGEVVRRVSFTGSGNFSVDTRDLPPTPTAVYTVREADGSGSRLVRWGVVTCGGHVTTLGLHLGGESESGPETASTRGLGLGFGCTD